MVFDLYQTHGIPSELVEEFAQEEGLTIDREGFEEALKVERERGQASWKGDLMAHFREEHQELVDAGVRSTFEGYDRLELDTEVLALIGDDGLEDELDAGESGEVVLAATPFYAESGGQVGDRGELRWDGGSARVLDTQKPIEGLIIHRVEVTEGRAREGRRGHRSVEEGPRVDTQRNHTATHLLHAALHRVLGDAAQQAGSLVEPDRLRFDFSWDGPVSFDELQEVERLVNAEIVRNKPVDKQVMPIDGPASSAPWPCSARSTATRCGW
jgi:alanyl-tRNA synthetase